MAAEVEAAAAAAAKSLGALLSGIAQQTFYKNPEITEELLREQLFPELPREEFTALHARMRALLKSIAAADMDLAQLDAFLTAQSRKQGGGGGGGLSAPQAAALTRFWKSQRARVRGSLLAQSRWEPGLAGLSWRVDLPAGGPRGGEARRGGPVALVELELSRSGEASELVCLELGEDKVPEVLRKLSDIQESIDRIARDT